MEFKHARLGLVCGMISSLLVLQCAPTPGFKGDKKIGAKRSEYESNNQVPQGVATQGELPPGGVSAPSTDSVKVSIPQRTSSSTTSASNSRMSDLLTAVVIYGVDRIFSNNPTATTTTTTTNSGTSIRPASTPTPNPETARPLKLTIMQTKYEAWWKDCLAVAVYDLDGNYKASAPVSCNKDSDSAGKTVMLPAFPYPACNVIRLLVSTYKNEGSFCSEHRSEPGFVCNGPYPASPTWTRSTLSGKEFFRVYDARNLSLRDRAIVYEDNWSAIESAALQHRGDGRNRMVMGFYEDQPTLGGLGVDFNDFVFSLVGENVRFTVEVGDRAANQRACDSQ